MNKNKKKSHLKNTIKESFRMSLEAIKDNKLRSILTLIGIAIGVFSVVGVMTAIKTLENHVNSQLDILGSNKMWIMKEPALSFQRSKEYWKRKNITYKDYLDLEKLAKTPHSMSAEMATYEDDISYKDKELTKEIKIYGATFWSLRHHQFLIDYGRSITDDDIRFNRKVVIIGPDIADILFPYEYPIGKKIKMEGIEHLVIGVTGKKGEMFGENQDYMALIPASTFTQYYWDEDESNVEIVIESKSQEELRKTRDEIIGHFRVIRKLKPSEKNNFEIINNKEIANQIDGFSGGIKLFAGAVSVIALLVAGIGIMNIMLVSVSDRIKEIGIRKAIGANRIDILIQFLMEAFFLCQFGGIIGIVLGILLGNLIGISLNVSPVIPIDWAFYGLFICSSIGIGFGIYPAWHAANLDPIDSLRYDK